MHVSKVKIHLRTSCMAKANLYLCSLFLSPSLFSGSAFLLFCSVSFYRCHIEPSGTVRQVIKTLSSSYRTRIVKMMAKQTTKCTISLSALSFVLLIWSVRTTYTLTTARYHSLTTTWTETRRYYLSNALRTQSRTNRGRERERTLRMRRQ